MRKVTKGVITIAGFGTRFLPVSKATPKEMMPILEKPIIQYIVEEMVAAGITDIVLITNGQKKMAENYFGRSYDIEQHLQDAGQTQLLEDIRKLDKLATFICVRQKGGYGNGVALLSAESAIDLTGEPFILAFGDDLVKSEVSFCTQLMEAYKKYGCPIIGAQEVPRSEISRYGIMELQGNTDYIKKIIEKPGSNQTKSNLAIFGRYLLTPEIFDTLRKTPVGKKGELWVADALELMLKTQKMAVRRVKDGGWYTTGDPLNYFKTLLAYSAERPEFRQALKDFTQKL